jgi:hypothetical protein
MVNLDNFKTKKGVLSEEKKDLIRDENEENIEDEEYYPDDYEMEGEEFKPETIKFSSRPVSESLVKEIERK